MSLAGKVGRKGRVIVMEEDTYGTLQTPLAGGALRHLDIGLQGDGFNEVDSEEKKQSPGIVNLHDRRATAGFDLRSAYLIPSGVLNTLPEANLFLKHGLGSVNNITHATTVSSGGTTTGATVADASLFVVGQMVLINLTGGSAPGLYVRRLSAVNTGTGVIAWTGYPLPSAIQNSNAVKGGITYSLISGEAAKGLSVFHYLDSTIKRAVAGAVIENLKLMFNANDDYKFAASGPAVEQIAAGSIASIPGFTTVGSKPQSGIKGRLEVGSSMAAYKALKADYDMANGYAIRNESLGYNKGEEFYRDGMRAVKIAIDARVEDPTVVYDNALAGTAIPVQLTAGLTEGSIVAVLTPRVRFKVPDTPDGTGALTWSFAGKCLESADAANDEIIVGLF